MNAQWLDKIEDYLQGKMSDPERALFEENLLKEPELSSTVQLYRFIENEMKSVEKGSQDETSLKEILDELNAIYFQPQTQHSGAVQHSEDSESSLSISPSHPISPTRAVFPHRKNLRAWASLAIAACLLAIVAVGIAWYMTAGKNGQKTSAQKNAAQQNAGKKLPAQPAGQSAAAGSTKRTDSSAQNTRGYIGDSTLMQQLFAKNFSRPSAPPRSRQGILLAALADYDHQSDKAALAGFNAAIEDLNVTTRGEEIPDRSRLLFFAHFYKGIILLDAGTPAQAIASLKRAVNLRSSSVLTLKAQWYLSLAHLKAGNRSMAISLLRHIADNKTEKEYKIKATGLLGQIDRQSLP